MASTTARIAGKPATLLSPILVSTDSKHIEIRLDADARFAAAAAGGARYLGEAGGLTPDAAGNSKLQSCSLAKRRSETWIYDTRRWKSH